MAEKIKRATEEVLGVASVIGSIYLGLCIYTYDKWDQSFFTFTKNTARNYGGVVGAYLSDLIISLIGYSSYALPVILMVYGIRRIFAKEPQKIHLLGSVSFIFASSLMLTLLAWTFNLSADIKPGGLTGFYLGSFLERYLSLLGAYLFAVSAFLSSVILLSPLSVTSLALSGFKTRSPVQDEPAIGIIENDIISKRPED